MNKVLLFNEYRLIERSESEINAAWKGAHLLLFFLAFVFGSFCTFCFHMLMYLFDEKCVLFPKLLSLTSLRHNVIYEFIPSTKDLGDMPVDFLSTQWVEKSTCSLPTYVPLVSGIFGLVWTTMFLMCSTGSRTLTGLQRPWRVLPPVFLFSLAMGGLCIYTSAVTHYGLQELCLKLGEITGSSTCTYTVNVATLTYERRIRGVYQATRLTILSAWLHTACWLLSALLALVRVLMAVDFQLVRVNVELHGDIDKILEKNEVQIRTVLPEVWINDESECTSDTKLPSKRQSKEGSEEKNDELPNLLDMETDLLYIAEHHSEISELSLLPEEQNRIARAEAYKTVAKDKVFIVKWLYDLVDTLRIPELAPEEPPKSTVSINSDLISKSTLISRQYGQAKIASHEDFEAPETSEYIDTYDDPSINKALGRVDSLILHEYHKVKKIRESFDIRNPANEEPSTSKTPEQQESVMNLTPDLRRILERVAAKKAKNVEISKKSNLKTIAVQTDKDKSKRGLRVTISEKTFVRRRSSDADDEESSVDKDDVDKETQTREKEKQD